MNNNSYRPHPQPLPYKGGESGGSRENVTASRENVTALHLSLLTSHFSPLTSHLSLLTYMDSLTGKQTAHVAHVAPGSNLAGLWGREA